MDEIGADLAALPIPVIRSCAVELKVIVPALDPSLVPPLGVAASSRWVPAGAASDAPHAAVILRVWAAGTVEVYWA